MVCPQSKDIQWSLKKITWPTGWRWLHGQEHILLSEKTEVPFSAPTSAPTTSYQFQL